MNPKGCHTTRTDAHTPRSYGEQDRTHKGLRLDSQVVQAAHGWSPSAGVAGSGVSRPTSVQQQSLASRPGRNGRMSGPRLPVRIPAQQRGLCAPGRPEPPRHGARIDSRLDAHIDRRLQDHHLLRLAPHLLELGANRDARALTRAHAGRPEGPHNIHITCGVRSAMCGDAGAVGAGAAAASANEHTHTSHQHISLGGCARTGRAATRPRPTHARALALCLTPIYSLPHTCGGSAFHALKRAAFFSSAPTSPSPSVSSSSFVMPSF
eukprot:7152851-Prymnesium_polylepis.1